MQIAPDSLCFKGLEQGKQDREPSLGFWRIDYMETKQVIGGLIMPWVISLNYLQMTHDFFLQLVPSTEPL